MRTRRPIGGIRARGQQARQFGHGPVAETVDVPAPRDVVEVEDPRTAIGEGPELEVGGGEGFDGSHGPHTLGGTECRTVTGQPRIYVPISRQRGRWTTWLSMNASSPGTPFSTPMPLHFMPANGWRGPTEPWPLIHAVPHSSCSASPDGPIGVTPPHRTRQPEMRRVRAGERIVDVTVGQHREDRAELLFVDESDAVVDVRDDGRLEEEPGAFDRCATCHGDATVRNRIGDEFPGRGRTAVDC